jgi:pimeloyl-ACP methyl ester carboxylesterase
MPYIERGGVKVYYEERGSGPAVLLSHGYSATSQMWKGQEGLAEKYHLITWDMRGHGLTDSPEDLSLYSEAQTVDDMAAILDACGEKTAVIGGLSLGGYMSMAFNVAHPRMVRALMLFDTGPGYKNPVAREGWNKTSEARAVNFETKGLAAMGQSAEVLASTHRSAEGLAKAARGMLCQFDSRVIESLPEIKVPTLIVLGENDTPFIGGTEYMAKKIPNAKLVTIANAGHASNIDQPAAFNTVVSEFLAVLAR